MVYSQSSICIPNYFLPGQENFLYLLKILIIFRNFSPCSMFTSFHKVFLFSSRFFQIFLWQENPSYFPFKKNNIQTKIFSSSFQSSFPQSRFLVSHSKSLTNSPRPKADFGVSRRNTPKDVKISRVALHSIYSLFSQIKSICLSNGTPPCYRYPYPGAHNLLDQFCATL